MIIIQSLEFLDIDKNNRNIQISHCRKHIVGCSVGQKLQEHQVNICRTELVPSLLGLLFCRDDTAVNDLYRIRDRFLERLILSLKFRHQRRELRQICS